MATIVVTAGGGQQTVRLADPELVATMDLLAARLRAGAGMWLHGVEGGVTHALWIPATALIEIAFDSEVDMASVIRIPPTEGLAIQDPDVGPVPD